MEWEKKGQSLINIGYKTKEKIKIAYHEKFITEQNTMDRYSKLKTLFLEILEKNIEIRFTKAVYEHFFVLIYILN